MLKCLRPISHCKPQRFYIHTSSSLKLPRYPTSNSNNNRTRVTKEITPEEVAKFKEAQERAKQSGSFDNVNTDSYQQTQSPYYSSSQYYIPNNKNGIITPQDPIYSILSEPTIVIERTIEYMNLMIGFEQINKYTIMNSSGEIIGFMEEKEAGIGRTVGRQLFRTRRPFEVDVFTPSGELALTIKRPFRFINSYVKSLLPGYNKQNDEPMLEIVGESVQKWHLFRRKYNLFKLEDEKTDDYEQFGDIDAPFLSFDFPIINADNKIIASIDRNWVGLGREMFTDTGVYILRFDKESFRGLANYDDVSSQGVTIDQRAIILSCFTSIDFDYFSRHSSGHGLFSFGGSYDDV
ncbi:uncharacterized protein KGF55_005776 [Candida pseudojiufengensis]|uniref:uncharacterized protein n=1 Tax=Candida pseudojiufengensis TaxID=497109 RepID=UPI00222546BE|nr:uncharacterized protein KGF55_005776 [Candida pseudojiufengensis]KAI5958516.1 hypothetical protein KGF55_005776 [Candida pseudojiufengensis]